MRTLRLEGVSKHFARADGGTVKVLRNINLTVEAGKFYTLLGPSGCGKSTLLNIVAGFEAPTEGTAYLDSEEIKAPSTDRTVIFQDVSNALFPWMNVWENTEFGPKMTGIPPAERAQRVEKYLKLVGLAEDRGKFPFELSGGMKQRVQIARALANDPEILLMDEPFAALDAITKRHLQKEFRKIWSDTAKTILYITHDIIEALLLSTHLAVMSSGPDADIRELFVIDLEEPRSPSNKDFAEMYSKIEALIDEEVQRTRAL
ncbi:MAG: ABC transporter ATP-binding protein [Lysobacterales bacterium]|nr:MAG: ABC transporter ATP-binding protein [Xanthomonadales bacterium]